MFIYCSIYCREAALTHQWGHRCENPARSSRTCPFSSNDRNSRHRCHRLVASSASNRSEELAALQNFKAGLGQALQDATAAAAVEAATPPPQSDEEADLTELTGENFWKTIKALPPSQLAVVMGYTNSCVPCKAAKPQLIEWVDNLEGQVAAFKLALTLPNKEVAVGMGVRSSPTFLFFRGGELVETFRGGKSLPDVKAYLFINYNK